MVDLDHAKYECEKKLRQFNNPKIVKEYFRKWDEDISNALDSLEESVSNMTINHKASLSSDVVNQWEQHIKESEKKYRDHRAATFEVVDSARASVVAASTSTPTLDPMSAPTTGYFIPSTQVKAAKVKNVIEAERISEEVTDWDKEIKRYDDWGNATNEEIEKAMRSIEEGRRRMAKIQDIIYSMKENVQLFNLPNNELTKGRMQKKKKLVEFSTKVGGWGQQRTNFPLFFFF